MIKTPKYIAIKTDKVLQKLNPSNPDAKLTPPSPHTQITYQLTSPPLKNKREYYLQKFKDYFKEDLIGHLDRPNPPFRTVVAGGYGVKTLMETKYNRKNAVKTNDLDITVSTLNASMSPLQAYEHWSAKISQFIQAQSNPDHFKIKVVNFANELVPVMNYRRNYVIMVTFKNGKTFDDFVDIAITNYNIHKGMIDKKTSVKAGLPIKKDEYYLKEFLTLIYMENVPGVNEWCYTKRNPITGTYNIKGLKDIQRSQVICEINPNNKYAKYCKMITSLNEDLLKGMKTPFRNAYFSKLDAIMTPVKELIAT